MTFETMHCTFFSTPLHFTIHITDDSFVQQLSSVVKLISIKLDRPICSAFNTKFSTEREWRRIEFLNTLSTTASPKDIVRLNVSNRLGRRSNATSCGWTACGAFGGCSVFKDLRRSIVALLYKGRGPISMHESALRSFCESLYSGGGPSIGGGGGGT